MEGRAFRPDHSPIEAKRGIAMSEFRVNRRRFLAFGTASAAALARGLPASAAQAPRPAAQTPASPPPLPPDAEARERARVRLMNVALGREPADTVIVNGTLLDTITGELLPDWGVAISGDRIAAMGDVRRQVGAKTTTVDARG